MIIRTYACSDCGVQFEFECDSGEDGDPDCPECSKILQWVPGMFSVKTEKSRAIDYTQKIVEQDYGLSNMNDQSREGDIAFKAPPPMQTSERESLEREVREYARDATTPLAIPQANQAQAQAAPLSTNMFGAASGTVAANPISAQAMLAGAKTGPQGPNPMNMLHEGIKSGQLQSKARMIARWRP